MKATRVAGVLLDAGADGEDVGVEDDVLGREAGLDGQQADGHAGRCASFRSTDLGLPCLVEGHDHHGRAVATGQAGLAQELLLALLEGDRVDDGPALGRAEAGLDDRPLRGIDHDGHPADVRLGGEESHETGHRRLGVEEAPRPC